VLNKRRRILIAAITLMAAAYAGLSIWQLTRASFSQELDLNLEDSKPYAAIMEAEASIPQPSPIVVCLPCQGPPLAEAGLSALRDISARLTEAGQALGERGWSLRSILTESIPAYQEGQIAFQALDQGAASSEAIRAAIGKMPTLGALFSPDGASWVIYLYPKAPKDLDSLRRLEKLLSGYPDALAAGETWISYVNYGALKRDLSLIVPLTVLFIFLVFLIIERAGFHSLLLCLSVMLPALGTFALYPLFGVRIKTTTLLAPILVITLSTTYVIHVFHHYSAGARDYSSFLKERGTVLFWSGITTLLGYASLILSDFPDLRVNGILIVIGMFLAFFWNLAVLPLFLMERNIRVTKGIFKPSFGKEGNVLSSRRPRGAIAGRIVVLCAYAACVPGIILLKPSMNLRRDLFIPRYGYSKTLAEFSRHYPVSRDICLYVDSGVEGGITDPAFFKGIEAASAAISALPFCGGTQNYAKVVRETGGILGFEGIGESEESIGETLELLPVDPDSPRLYDLGYRTAIIRIGVKDDSLALAREADEGMRKISDIVSESLPGRSVVLAGSLPKIFLVYKAQIASQLYGLIAYFALVFVLVLMRIKSLGKTLLICLGPVLAILSSLGLCGYLGWALSPCLSLAMATLAGVGIDDAFLWHFFRDRPFMRRSALGTALLLVFGLSPLLLSAYSDLMRSACAVIMGFVFSTSYVLKVLPWKQNA
jgi:predicted RND superfamily exporter protein